MVVAVQEIRQQQGWSGEVSILRTAEPDDSRWLSSAPSDGSSDSHSITFKFEDPSAQMLSGKRLSLQLRCCRMANGQPSGTGTPTALTVLLQSSERTVLSAVVTPGRFWQNFEWLLPTAAQGNAIDLQLTLSVPGTDRQVAVSACVIDQASDEALALAEPVLTADAKPTASEIAALKRAKLRRRRPLRPFVPPAQTAEPVKAIEEKPLAAEPNWFDMRKAEIVAYCEHEFGETLDRSKTKINLVEEASLLWEMAQDGL